MPPPRRRPNGSATTLPALFYGGTGLVSYAAWKDHYSIYPVRDVPSLAKELKPYVPSKGTIQFPANKRIPAALVRKVIRALLKQNEARAAKRQERKTSA